MISDKPKKPNPSPSDILPSDPRYPIWGRVWLCKVPRISHYSTNYLENYGLPTSGSKSMDKALMTQLAPVYITINRMVELFEDHQMVSIVRQCDVKPIYEICQDWLFDWADTIRNSIFVPNVPYQDLIALDEFSEALYQYAAHEYGNEFARTFVPEGVMKNVADLNTLFDAVDKRVKDRGKKIDTVTRDNKYSARKQKQSQPTVEQEKVIELPPRPSVKEMLVAYMENRGDR